MEGKKKGEKREKKGLLLHAYLSSQVDYLLVDLPTALPS